MAQLLLYYIIECYYCEKVFNFMKQNQITVPTQNRDQTPQTRMDFIKMSGRSQVPCLMIDGKPLFESDDIIKWMQNNLLKK